MKLHRWKDIERSRFTDEERAVVKAEMVDDRLIVWSCEAKRYEVNAREIPALARRLGPVSIQRQRQREPHSLGGAMSTSTWTRSSSSPIRPFARLITNGPRVIF